MQKCKLQNEIWCISSPTHGEKVVKGLKVLSQWNIIRGPSIQVAGTLLFLKIISVRATNSGAAKL